MRPSVGSRVRIRYAYVHSLDEYLSKVHQIVFAYVASSREFRNAEIKMVSLLATPTETCSI